MQALPAPGPVMGRSDDLRPRGQLEHDVGGWSEPRQTCDVCPDLPPSHEASRSKLVRFSLRLQVRQVFGLVSASADAEFLFPPLPSP
jgi:hypothetical protein